ncbi:MAG: hypothetical protein FJ138_04265 [Deltaproteobacteria bacterium]|nr:hypothetical protein [Deltaproteobacteria bacterium]
MTLKPSTRLEREILHELHERVARTMARFVPTLVFAIVGVGLVASLYPTVAVERVVANLSSGFAREEALRDLQESGLVTLLSKPYRRAQLSVAVRDALAARPARQD